MLRRSIFDEVKDTKAEGKSKFIFCIMPRRSIFYEVKVRISRGQICILPVYSIP